MPVIEGMSKPVPSTSTSPRRVGFRPYCKTSTIGTLPVLQMQPSDFSSRVVRPPSMLPVVRKCSPGASRSVMRFAASSIVSTIASATCGSTARRASRWPAPMASVVSENMAEAPAATSRSTATPRAGLAARPEVASDPPHSSASVRPARPTGSRFSPAALRTICPTTFAPSAIVFESPTSWMTKCSRGLDGACRAIWSATLRESQFSQPRPSTSTPATLGWAPSPARTFSVRATSWPQVQPPVCPRATAPGTCSAMRRAVSPAQSTVGITATWLRTPRPPSARRYASTFIGRLLARRCARCGRGRGGPGRWARRRCR